MKMDTAPAGPLLTALEQLAPHDHLCSIYESPEEHFAVAIPFIRIGLDRGEKCIYIADDGTEAVVREAMYAEGIDVERAIATDSLVLEKKEAAYLKHGSFDPEWMFTFWADATAEAMSQGFSALRATGETEWVLRGAPGLERWMEYESRLAHVLARHNCSALCQYNRRLFPPELVLDVIRTHPTVIYRGVVCRNMYHVPPDELLGTDQPAREVERLLTNIREREEIEYTLRQQRNELQDERRRDSGRSPRTSARCSGCGMSPATRSHSSARCTKRCSAGAAPACTRIRARSSTRSTSTIARASRRRGPRASRDANRRAVPRPPAGRFDALDSRPRVSRSRAGRTDHALVGVAEDITERQRQLEDIQLAEAALRSSEERWRLGLRELRDRHRPRRSGGTVRRGESSVSGARAVHEPGAQDTHLRGDHP